ncbi:hypothetical protein HDU67_009150 [Dinochytrium kinnereticum]|nr:hypothetical protein HDU67_009150 [Dinochytrium kinnereticum]
MSKGKEIRQTLVASRSIAVASLHSKLSWEHHGYAWPFVFVYLALLYVIFFEYDRLLGSREFMMLMVILTFAVNALVYLACQWSVSVKAWLTCKKESDAYKASVIRIIPVAHNGAGAICELKKSEFKAESGKKKKYIYDEDKKQFFKLRFPFSDGKPMSFFNNSRGLITGHQVKEALDTYGPNKFDIPLPTFAELFREHAVAPFFVFQLFCVALWFLDEMWYYSIFTLVMLFVFESTVVFQRLKSLQEFRSMSIKPYPIFVYRLGSWTEIQTDDLLPGDICSILRSKDEAPVPADLLVIGGSCIANEAMLSGESTPQLKEAVGIRDQTDILDVEVDKNCVLFGGTKILQVTSPEKAISSITAPDGGCIAYVLRTGFSTQQGKLIRTIIYSTERITANNLESLLFILFLLIFAVMAAAYVWVEGTKNEERKRSKVLLDCILIVTSVVPPELPMELSLAVNNSLISLAKCYVFCTEPFRIPFAGKIDIACFDKTGTLTSENLLVEGVTGIGTGRLSVKKPVDYPIETMFVLASAHALVMLEDGVIGDPMEKNTLEFIDWSLSKDSTVTPRKAGDKSSLKILRRFQFSSALKRMSTVSTLTSQGNTKLFVAVKGAPETLRSMYATVPADYDEIYKYWARRGSRVLALGYKTYVGKTASAVNDMLRDEVESKLIFAGFLVFLCPLKPDSAQAIQMLNNSSHRCVMITGDNALTACHVAKEVSIVSRDVLIGEDRGEAGFNWRTVDETITIAGNINEPKLDANLKGYDLCVTGKGLMAIYHTPCFAALLPKIKVYARVSPSQKEDILTSMKLAGFSTLMCGDGTNDVGALKQAHVGIALLDGKKEDIDKLNAIAAARRQQALIDQQAAMKAKFGLPPDPPQENTVAKALLNAKGGTSATTAAAATGAVKKSDAKKGEAVKNPATQLNEQVNQISQMLSEMEADVPVIKFGDASVAAPFTSKLASVLSVCDIVRQGRSTLVAMVQMYKILALNCLISAYSMSVMYLAGIKQGDWQATIGGLMITFCFFGIAKSTALETLSKKRPQSNVFNFYLILSILGQVAIHVASLIYIRAEAIEYSEELDEEISIDAEFKPNLLNSAVYLVSLIMQISTFAINYQGEPFRESLFKNKALYNSIGFVGCIAVASATEISEGLNDWLQLVPFPGDFRYKLLATMAFDFFGAWLVEAVTSALFSDNRPKKALMDDD